MVDCEIWRIVMAEKIFDKIGGETQVRRLVERFYDLIEHDPKDQSLHQLHQRGHGLTHAKQAQFEFLCEFFGGPKYFSTQHKAMNLRQIHAHVPMTQTQGQTWLRLMQQALSDCQITEPNASTIMTTFQRAADVLVNDAKMRAQ